MKTSVPQLQEADFFQLEMSVKETKTVWKAPWFQPHLAKSREFRWAELKLHAYKNHVS